MIYKDPKNNLHDIDPDFAYLLPANCVSITQKEANAIIESKVIPPTYQEQRSAAYPSLADQLDAMWKGAEAAAAMREAIHAVKAEFPKP